MTLRGSCRRDPRLYNTTAHSIVTPERVMSAVITRTETQVLQRGGPPKIVAPPPGGYFVEEDLEQVKEEEGMMDVPADKKTDQQEEPAPSGGYLWRFSSGVYNLTTGAVSGAASASVNGAKWVAGTGKNFGSAIYQKVPSVSLRRKDKKE